LAAAAKERLARLQVTAYRELSTLLEFFATFLIAPFDQAAADLFDSLQAAMVRIATRDLKIAAISLDSNALLLTANRRDFEKVPGLRFENWLE
jgi:tRNA(fMet)-specific endonuclease VapC